MTAERLTLIPLRRLARLGGTDLVGKSAWALADQALASLTNLVTMVLLARNLAPKDFGTFTLVYTVLFAVSELQSALITQPHNILGAKRQGQAYRHYTTGTAVSQVFFTVFAVLAAAVVAGVAQVAGWGAASWLVILVPTIFAWQMQGFVRSVLITKAEVAGAFMVDLVSGGGQLVGIVVLSMSGRLTAETALMTVAGTCALAAVLGAWQVRSHAVFALRGVQLRATLTENWRFARWLLGGSLLSMITAQLYPVMIAGFVGLAATGAMRAVWTVMGPVNILFNVTNLLFNPRASVTFADGDTRALHSLIRGIGMTLVPLVTLYCLAVSLGAKPLLQLLYGDRYTQYTWLVVVIALNYVLESARTTASIALRGMEDSQVLFHADLWTALITVTLGVSAVYFLGFPGVAFGLLANPLIRNAVLWKRYVQRLRQAHRTGTAASAAGALWGVKL